MAWVKLDDQFYNHPKVVAAGDAAGWLYVTGLCYAAQQLTDGFIPRGQIPRLTGLTKAEQLAHRLVEAGLWETSEGGYRIHDYLAYNPSAEQVKAEREAARVRMDQRRHSQEVQTNKERTSENVSAKRAGTSQEVQRPRTPIGAVAPIKPDPRPQPDPPPDQISQAAAADHTARASPPPEWIAAAVVAVGHDLGSAEQIAVCDACAKPGATIAGYRWALDLATQRKARDTLAYAASVVQEFPKRRGLPDEGIAGRDSEPRGSPCSRCGEPNCKLGAGCVEIRKRQAAAEALPLTPAQEALLASINGSTPAPPHKAAGITATPAAANRNGTVPGARTGAGSADTAESNTARPEVGR